MESQINNLRKYAVRIKTDKEILGSGVLWKPEVGEQNKLYVFTAAHVIKNHENIVVEFLDHDDVVELSIDNKNITTSKTYVRQGDFGDAGIIILDYIYDDFPSYKFATFQNEYRDIFQDKKLLLIGFPKEGYLEESYDLSRDELGLEYIDVDNSIFTLKYRIASDYNINVADRNSELLGFSGAGVFFVSNSELFLAGIHKGSSGYNAERGNLLGTTSDFIRKMCCENQFDIPVLIGAINGNLSDQIEYFKEEILEDINSIDDSEKLWSLLAEIVGEDLSEAISGSFYDFCEVCHYKKNYHQCKYFRGFLLVLAVFLKALDEKVNLNSPKVIVQKEIPVYFVCSEGLGKNTQAHLKVSHFVYALKSQKELAHRLVDNCIIIWGSHEQPKDNQKKCTNSEYRSILMDISRRQGSVLDIASLSIDSNPKAIIHIDEIINMLCNGEIKQLHKKFVEYIEGLE